MLSKSTHHGNCWPRTWQWDSWHVDSIKGGMTALKVYIPLSLSSPLNWLRATGNAECPGAGRISSQMRGSDWPIVIQWISHLASTALPPGSFPSKSFFFFCYRRFVLLLVETVKEIKSNSRDTLPPHFYAGTWGLRSASSSHSSSMKP